MFFKTKHSLAQELSFSDPLHIHYRESFSDPLNTIRQIHNIIKITAIEYHQSMT
uniref:Uncharacterized protein n=1 Tax=Arion vulgaris TaxID=1028688 RepID=A0A0B7BH88_9EUPU